MAERRALVEGLKAAEAADRAKEKAFVFGQDNAHPHEAPGGAADLPLARNVKPAAGRVPLTTRVRPDIADRLKRVSLGRQLDNIEPSAVQDIVEEALELWFAADARAR